MRVFFPILLFICVYTTAQGGVLLSELSPADSENDWVELEYRSDEISSLDISGLYVTGYYGKEEKISANPVTLYSRDNPATPYDERFCVVIFASGIDETDLTGDINRNGILEVYVDNTSLRSTESALAIDSDADFTNGMIDFFAFDTDDLAGDLMASYIGGAVACGEWNGAPLRVTSLAGKSIARRETDGNTASDFCVTSLQTPGRPNRFGGTSAAAKLIRVSDNNLLQPWKDNSGITFTVLSRCSCKIRLYSPDGMLVYETKLLRDLSPGKTTIPIARTALKKMKSGIYIMHIAAVSDELHVRRERKVTLVISRFR